MEDGTGRFFINRSGTGGNPKRGGDFEEEDVWSIEMERSEDSSLGIGKSKAKDSTGPRIIPRANYSPKVAQQSSAPVNIPDWSKVYGSHGNSNKGKKMCHEEEGRKKVLAASEILSVQGGLAIGVVDVETFVQGNLLNFRESGEIVRKERKPTNLRLAVGGSRGGHFASSSSSLPALLLEDSQLKKKPRIEVAGGEGNETNEELRASWTPAFETFSRHQITYGDCTKLSSSVVYEILQVGSLPRDVNEASKDPASMIGEIAPYLVLVKEIVVDVYSACFKAGVKWYHDHLMATLNPSEGSYIRTLLEPATEQLVMPNPNAEEQGA
ncbi:hypothetical protein RHSIM_Rhsim13G0153800 [Rhododendron simsii]|uniref:Uncharacterized protein n=1 Tax=Rhododendron simsii TaxID=118357 RepID=A0A834L7U2_RHOSS|nr:hypothetical protein RHSIM_Rhsim13G0153800 [Rhododendron simsii]